MEYAQVKDMKLSRLGMGNMRLPTTAERGPIDYEKAREIVHYAYEHGVNYYDTAYRYHQGESEPFIGKAMKEFPRSSWYLASKMPGHMMSYKDGKIVGIGYLTGFERQSVEWIFEKQLENCQVDYFDFYLLHNLSEGSYDFYTNEEVGLFNYLVKQKAAGRIRHLGISSHGRADTIEKFLKWAGGQVEIAQIQLNYLDWALQDAKAKYDVLTRYGVPVVAMEPVRGGRLAALGEAADAMLKAARPNDSIASWAFRYLQSLPNVAVALSGMSTMAQVRENVELYSTRYEPMPDAEKELLQKAVDTVADMIPCTECRYCTEDCPQQLDIPKLISMFNEANFGNARILARANETLGEAERPSACVSCGVCAQLCPQGIDIPGVLGQFAEAIKNA